MAFQFSHHQLEHDGTITHQSEYISNQPGEFPNFLFAMALRDTLNNDAGTIFKFAAHENTIINAIIKQLLESKKQDKDELIEFLKTISKSKTDSTSSWEGERNIVDLRKIVLDYYYNLLTKGSNSIKAVLPAVIQSSTLLRNKYRRPLKEIGVSSFNFLENHIWLNDDISQTISPYKMLPPLFEGWNEEEKE